MTTRTVYENNGYMMLLDAVYFNGVRFGNISEDGLEWAGEDAQTIELWAAQMRSAAVAEITTRQATNVLTGKLIELTAENCQAILGGKIVEGVWYAPARNMMLEGELKIVTGTGQTIRIPRASLKGVIRGGLGGEKNIGIQFTLKLMAPKDGSNLLSIGATVPFIEADPKALTFPAAGGSQALDVEASGPFAPGAVPAGFSLQLVNGRVTVTAEANASAAERTGSIVFTLEDDPTMSVTVSLSQPKA